MARGTLNASCYRSVVVSKERSFENGCSNFKSKLTDDAINSSIPYLIILHGIVWNSRYS